MGDSIWNNFLDETMKERYELVAERIVEISKEPQVPECYKDYFSEAAAYLEKTMELCQMAIAGTLQQRSLETCKGDQEFLYHHMLPGLLCGELCKSSLCSYCFWRKRRRTA